MIAYKGFTKDIWSKHGNGEKSSCQFKIGETKTVSESQTARSGFIVVKIRLNAWHIILLTEITDSFW